MQQRKTMWAVRLIALFLFLMPCWDAWGATYYIDNRLTDTYANSATPDTTTYNPLTGASTGGTASAYARLGDTKTFAAGDNIYLIKGLTYVENWVMRSSGEAGNYVTYGAYGTGADPIVQGRIRIRSAYSAGGNYSIVQDIDVIGSGYMGFQISGFDHIIIRRVDISSCTTYGVEALADTGDYTDDLLMEDCTIHDNASYGIWATFGDGCVIRRVTAYNAGGGGNNISASPSGTGTLIIEDCITYGSTGGVGIGTALSHADQSTIIRRCKSYGNYEGGITGHGTAAGTVYFYSNIVYGNTGAGTAFGIGVGNGSTSNANKGVIVNNTIYDNETMGIYHLTANTVSIVNNIAWNNGTYELARGGLAGATTSDYNCIDSTGNCCSNDGGVTWAAWQALGYDAHSIITDPLFVSTTDFHLLAGSPCIWAGTTVGPTLDYDNKAFHTTTPSLGGLEFAGHGANGPGQLSPGLMIENISPLELLGFRYAALGAYEFAGHSHFNQ